jgi:DNA-nicking Smr family endonuclease
MGKKEGKHINSDDDKLFRNAVGDAVPINSRSRHRPDASPVGRAHSRRRDEQAALEESRQTPMSQLEPEFTDTMAFQRGMVTRRLMRELRRGRIAIQDELDLHGCTRAEARELLQAFLGDSTRQGYRCVRIVHGKGYGSGPDGPVLKTAVNRWLRKWESVAAFCPARQCDGGTGALYVLLR